MNTLIHIVVADAQPFYLEGLESILREEKGFVLLGHARNGEELLHLAEQHHPDIAIVDIELPVIDGIEATRRIKQLSPARGVIALTTHCEHYPVLDMIAAGATGYLLKTAGPAELHTAVEAVHSGHTYYAGPASQAFREHLTGKGLHPQKPVPLSPRERDITRLICREYSSKQIAADLHLNIKTIESHRRGIFAKTGVQNVVGLVTYAIRTGLFKP